MPPYRTLVGLNYKPAGSTEEVRVEADVEVDDLPAGSIPWLLDGDCIEDVANPRPEPDPEPVLDVPVDVPEPVAPEQPVPDVAADPVPADVPEPVPAPDPSAPDPAPEA